MRNMRCTDTVGGLGLVFPDEDQDQDASPSPNCLNILLQKINHVCYG
jgi:hypothetical protein